MRTKNATSHAVVTLADLNENLGLGAKVIVSRHWANLNGIKSRRINMAKVKQGKGKI